MDWSILIICLVLNILSFIILINVDYKPDKAKGWEMVLGMFCFFFGFITGVVILLILTFKGANQTTYAWGYIISASFAASAAFLLAPVVRVIQKRGGANEN